METAANSDIEAKVPEKLPSGLIDKLQKQKGSGETINILVNYFRSGKNISEIEDEIRKNYNIEYQDTEQK